MVELLHEVWVNDEFNMVSCTLASRANDEYRERVEPGSRLVHQFFASSLLEAMTKYHEWQGWAPYKPIPDLEYEPYTEAQLRQQMVDRPEAFVGKA